MTALLVADNDFDWLQNMSDIIREGGFEVLQASDPSQAIAVLDRHEVDLAILDLRLENDTDEDDRTGLDVAERTDRMIPKIIVSQFASLADAADKLKIDISGFPSIVDFVEKDKVSTKLLPAIEKAMQIRQTWFALSQTTVSNQLNQDYRDARRDARIHYAVSMIMAVGFALPILYGAFKLHDNPSLAVLFAVLGVLVAEITNYLFSRKLEFLYKRVERFHAELLQTNRFQQLLEMSYQIRDEKLREEFKLRLFDAAANQWLRPTQPELPAAAIKITAN